MERAKHAEYAQAECNLDHDIEGSVTARLADEFQKLRCP
jgi:hypothetical protein